MGFVISAACVAPFEVRDNEWSTDKSSAVLNDVIVFVSFSVIDVVNNFVVTCFILEDFVFIILSNGIFEFCAVKLLLDVTALVATLNWATFLLVALV